MLIKTYYKFIIISFLSLLLKIFFIFFSLVFVLNIFEEISYFKDTDSNLYIPIFLTMLNIPSVIFEIFPFIFLITTQFFYIKIMERNELIIFKNFGLNNIKILKIILNTTFVLGILLVLIFYNFSSKFKHLYLELKNNYSNDNKYLAVITNNGLWIKDEINGQINMINANMIDDNFLYDVGIVVFDKDFNLIKNIKSKKINIENNTWFIEKARISESNFESYDLENFFFESNFDSEKINSLYSNLSSLTLFELRKLKRDYKELGYSSIEIDAQNHKLYSFPFFIVLMTLFSGIIMINIGYNKSKLMHLIIGIFFSVTIYYFTYFSHTLGENEKIPVILSIWMPLVLLTLLCSVGLVKINDK
jgi:lipopolysaccharide export system permease protein